MRMEITAVCYGYTTIDILHINGKIKTAFYESQYHHLLTFTPKVTPENIFV